MEKIAPPSEEAAQILNFNEFKPEEKPKGKGSRGKSAASTTDNILTEDGAAQKFVELHRNKLRFCHTTGSWFEWDGVSWRRDNTGRAFHWARMLARELSIKHPAKLRFVASKVSFASGVERFARSDPDFAVTAETWDQDIYLLGTPQGTVDLRTGKLRRHGRGQRSYPLLPTMVRILPDRRYDRTVALLWLRPWRQWEGCLHQHYRRNLGRLRHNGRNGHVYGLEV
jgi:phage/plasmid-associated DNA primase